MSPIASNVAPVIILELVDRQKSDFILEGSEKSGNPIHKDGPSFRRIIPTSHVMWDFKDGTAPRPRAIRHIQGAVSIFVDEQDKAGNKFDARRDNIYFPADNILTVVCAGRDIIKHNYLQAAEFNQDQPNPVNKFRDSIVYKEIRSEEIAVNDVKSLKFESQASAIIASLYNEVSEGEFTYDRERMDIVAHALGIQGENSDAVLLMLLSSVAKANPKLFCLTVADRLVEMRAMIEGAIQLGVIAVAKGQVTTPSNGAVLVTLKTGVSKRKDQIDAIAEYLSSEDGANAHTQVLAEVAAARARVEETA